jgi:hypothetical protein
MANNRIKSQFTLTIREYASPVNSWWLSPAILAMQEVEIRRIKV